MTIADVEPGVVSIALNAAGSWKFPGVPDVTTLHTGEHTVYASGTYFGRNEPFGLQFVTTELG
jgi:hypothetical protein